MLSLDMLVLPMLTIAIGDWVSLCLTRYVKCLMAIQVALQPLGLYCLMGGIRCYRMHLMPLYSSKQATVFYECHIRCGVLVYSITVALLWYNTTRIQCFADMLSDA
jgi:hypothetical protein